MRSFLAAVCGAPAAARPTGAQRLIVHERRQAAVPRPRRRPHLNRSPGDGPRGCRQARLCYTSVPAGTRRHPFGGGIAQLGERMAGSQKVTGSGAIRYSIFLNFERRAPRASTLSSREPGTRRTPPPRPHRARLLRRHRLDGHRDLRLTTARALLRVVHRRVGQRHRPDPRVAVAGLLVRGQARRPTPVHDASGDDRHRRGDERRRGDDDRRQKRRGRAPVGEPAPEPIAQRQRREDQADDVGPDRGRRPIVRREQARGADLGGRRADAAKEDERGAAGSGLTGSECTRTSSATREGGEDGGGNRARTGDLLAASQTLSQLSYTPTEGVPTCADRHGSIAQACLPATAWPHRQARSRSCRIRRWAPVGLAAAGAPQTAAREDHMDRRYDPHAIEQKWQRIWKERDAYRTPDESDKPTFYCLDFFPYPSGDGLSVGHLRNYVPTDAVARFRRMQGFNVLHPMGWDAFGLPAENYAIKMGVHPRVTTARNIANYHRQMDLIGLSFDWSREITSCFPDYYRWTQWFFLLLYERGLAYRSTGRQWWCPSCKTILANEQVEQGKCWRCGSDVTKKDLEQWYLRITEYAQRLLDDLGTIDWPDPVGLHELD